MIRRREYPDYPAYLSHQIKKTSNPRLREMLLEKWDARVKGFKGEFAALDGIVPQGVKALCLGARMGEEVQALRDLGYNAIGIDLVPYPPMVLTGDFQHMPFADDRFALVYSNAVDHVFDLERFAAEIRRVLTTPGWVLARLAPEHFGRYESLAIGTAEPFLEQFSDFQLVSRRDLGEAGLARKIHLLLHRPAQ